jgi:hypothetical protein
VSSRAEPLTADCAEVVRMPGDLTTGLPNQTQIGSSRVLPRGRPRKSYSRFLRTTLVHRTKDDDQTRPPPNRRRQTHSPIVGFIRSMDHAADQTMFSAQAFVMKSLNRLCSCVDTNLTEGATVPYQTSGITPEDHPPEDHIMIKLRNVGTVDRVIRLILGIALIAIVFVGPQTPWGWLGLIPLATAFGRFCPAYWLMGTRTCAVADKS